MDLRKEFGVDKEHAELGKWFSLTDETRVRVAKLGNPSFSLEVIRLQKPFTSVLRSAKVDNRELIDRITTEAMGKTILTDWENLSLDGELIEYSAEKAIEVLTEFPDFREVISNLSGDRSNFLLEDVVGK